MTLKLEEVKTAVLSGKQVKFTLTDGHGTLKFQFGKVVLEIVAQGQTHTYRGDFKKLQKTFGRLEMDGLEFVVVE